MSRVSDKAYAEGLAAHKAGRPGDAVAHYRQAVAEHPGHYEAWAFLGIALLQTQAAALALEALDQALEAMPNRADLHDHRGSALRLLGRWGEAEAAHAKAVALDPARPGYRFNRANARADQGKWADAITDYQAVLRQSPDDQGALLNLGVALRAAGEAAAAEKVARQLIVAAPQDHRAHYNLGNALSDLDRPAEARLAYEQALALRPGFGPCLVNLANLLRTQGAPGPALALYDQALAAGFSSPDVITNRALGLLQAGRTEEGWAAYEARFDAQALTVGDDSRGLPAWGGEALDGRHLLIWGEQGVGDEIRFAAIYPDVLAKTAGQTVTISTDPRLIPLFETSFPGCQIVGRGQPCGGEVQIAAGSLYRLFRPQRADFPDPHPPWLCPAPGLSAQWRDRLAALPPGPKVGIAWRSGAIAGDRAKLYPAAEDLAPVLKLAHVTFIDLQYGDTADERAALAQAGLVPPTRWAELNLKDDFAAVAALMTGLDLIITADTAVKDLAGAVGRPVWCLIHQTDWTHLGGSYDPWYPAKRNFLKPAGAPWLSVAQMVADALKQGLAA